MSDDLIERLRERATLIDGLHHFSDAMTGKSEDAGLHTEAADALAAKDTALSEMVRGLSALVHCQSPLSRKDMREAAAGLLAQIGAKPIAYEDQSPFVARMLAAETALSEMRAERDEARELAQMFSQASRKVEWIARATAVEEELARVRTEAASQFKRDGEKLTEADRRAEALRKALEPFAVKLSWNYDGLSDHVPFTSYFSVGQVRAAARALAPSTQAEREGNG